MEEGEDEAEHWSVGLESNLRQDSLIDIIKSRGRDTCVGEFMSASAWTRVQNCAEVLGTCLDCYSPYEANNNHGFCLRMQMSDAVRSKLRDSFTCQLSSTKSVWCWITPVWGEAANFTNQHSQNIILQTPAHKCLSLFSFSSIQCAAVPHSS